MKIRIYYEDTDAGGIVYHANYIKYCERARSEMFFDPEVKPFSKDGHFVVSEIRAKFKKPAVLSDILTAELKKMSAIVKQQLRRLFIFYLPEALNCLASAIWLRASP